jgi:nucleoside-diphosphate-sugar epimerase
MGIERRRWVSELYLVTGGSGYFGSNLVGHLLEQGLQVRIFDCIDADDRPPGVELVCGDIRDQEAVRQACQDVTVVHHNVAMVPLAKDAGAFRSVNIDGTRNLLEAARCAGVRKVVHTSSSAIFGVPASNPVTEETKPSPGEAYGHAKLEAEQACRVYADNGLDVTMIRPRTIMGHGRLGIMQILFEWLRTGRNLPVFDGGDNIYQFVHAADLAAACIAAGRQSGSRVYNIGAEQFGSLRETLQGLIDHAGTGSRVRSLPMRPMQLGMQVASTLGISPLGAYHSLMYGRSLYFDITRAKRELDFQPRYSNIEMFCESYDWYLEHREQVMADQNRSHHRSALKQGVLKLVGRLL